jgi:hypothetical protein
MLFACKRGATMNKKLLVLLILFLCTVSCVDNKTRDKPLRGEWNFQLEKVWEIDGPGEDVFGQPFSLNVSPEGWLYVFDPKNNINYIFDSEGQFVKAFARGGQGPGEIIRQELIHIVGDFLIIPGLNGVHYFTKKGDFVKTVKQEKDPLDPRLFIDEKNFISAPLTAVNLPEGKAKIVRKNLETMTETIISDYSLTQAGVASNESQMIDMIVISLSPIMTLCLQCDKLYWGLSDTFTIHISDLNGQTFGSISLNRKRRSIPDSAKAKYFASIDLPPELLPQMVKSFPDVLTFFCRLEVHNDLLYVYIPDLDVELGRTKIKQIDIFSLDGKYLYKANVDIGSGLTHLFSPLGNFVIKDGFVYAVCEREDDSVVIIKSRAALPLR